MEIGVSGDQSNDAESTPFTTSVRKSQQGREERKHPDLSNHTMERTLVEIFGTVCESQHSDNLDGSRWSGEKVTGQGTEVSDSLESKSEVGLDRSGGDISNETDEVQAPERLVSPSGLDIGPCRRLFEGSETLGGIVAENSVDHDDFLTFGVPGSSPEPGLGADGGGRKIDHGDGTDDEGKNTLEKQKPEPSRVATDVSHLEKTSGKEGRNDS